jgi:PPOX class probable F420-dependent enzyme
MVAIPDSAREVIESGKLAHYVTLNRDGSPQVTIVWAGTDGDELVMAHFAEHQKVKNVRRDPRVSVSFETDSFNDAGLQEYLVVHGTARIEERGAPELLQKLAYTYIGLHVGKFPPGDAQMPPGYITRITPLRFGGVGPWAGQ